LESAAITAFNALPALNMEMQLCRMATSSQQQQQQGSRAQSSSGAVARLGGGEQQADAAAKAAMAGRLRDIAGQLAGSERQRLQQQVGGQEQQRRLQLRSVSGILLAAMWQCTLHLLKSPRVLATVICSALHVCSLYHVAQPPVTALHCHTQCSMLGWLLTISLAAPLPVGICSRR
jgi:hypothetical protein